MRNHTYMAAIKHAGIADQIVEEMCQPGRASFIVGGQWGSEAKGCAAAWLGTKAQFDLVTTNAGAQAGHTSTHQGKRRVSFHLPTLPFIQGEETGNYPIVYLNAGSVIDPEGFLKEQLEYRGEVWVHPNAAIITGDCAAAERDPGSSQTKIASTQKGVGEAISRKVRRASLLAKDCPDLKNFISPMDINQELCDGLRVLVEVPQGVSLSIDSRFYPHTTSRNCTPMQAMSDAGIHPSFYGSTMVVLRTFPIRVGNIVATNGEEVGNSGSCYEDQWETSWDALGVDAEITTVTKRVRRVFTFSKQQIRDTFALCRPDVIFLSFVNYLGNQEQLNSIVRTINEVAIELYIPTPHIVYEYGPTTEDVSEYYDIR